MSQNSHETLSDAQILAAVRSEATAYGRCCDCYQDGFGEFCCHECGQKTMAMLNGVQGVVGVHSKDGSPIPKMEQVEALRAALMRRAAPDMLAALKRVTEQLAHEHYNDEAWVQARAAIAKAEGR